jgi:hypothetical protein
MPHCPDLLESGDGLPAAESRLVFYPQNFQKDAVLLWLVHKEVFRLHVLSRLFFLLAVDQFRAPRTQRVEANAKLSSAFGVHAAPDSFVLNGQGRTQRAKNRIWVKRWF